MRYVLAAYALRDCSEVIELGGYVTPIDRFTVPHQKVTTIDPLFEKSEVIQGVDGPVIRRVSGRFQDIDIERPVRGRYGVAILGLELHMPESGWKKLYNLIQESHRTVLGVPVNHLPSLTQYKKIRDNTDMETLMTIDMTLWEPGLQTKNALRKLFVIGQK